VVKDGDGWYAPSHKGGIGLPAVGAFFEVVSIADMLETHKAAPAILALTIAVGVVTVLGEVSLDFTKLADVLLSMYVPCKAMVQGVALYAITRTVGGVRGVHGNDVTGMDGVSVEGVQVAVVFTLSSRDIMVWELI